MTDIRISVIVCTLNRVESLRRCLDALIAQTMTAETYEIIVVDNGSTDDTAHQVAGIAGITLVSEPRTGLAIARNTGLRHTKAPLVAFTDDDAEPSPDWLCRLAETFDEMPEMAAGIGGEIDPVWTEEPPDWMTIELLRLLSARLGWSLTPRYLLPGEWICEANCAYRRDCLLDHGGFPEQLGRSGKLLLSGENAVNQRIEASGHRFYFDPGLRVRHHIDPARATKSWFRNRVFWQGVTGYLVDEYLGTQTADLVVNGAPIRQPRHLSLPNTPETWTNSFSDTHTGSFSDTLPQLWSLGYALASQGMIGQK